MITVAPFSALGAFQNDWLDAHYHFSFAGYHDPGRMGVGVLRVWNDDAVAPHGGFATHGHEDMEVITYVRAGAITHQDDLGNRGVLRAGHVQVMHAGTGIRHSEMNETDEICRLFQIWILPDHAGHKPGWETRRFPTDPVAGRLPVLASGRAGGGHDGALPLHQDAALHGGRVSAGEAVHHLLGPGRAAYVVPVTGTIELNGIRAGARDGITITGEDAIAITAVEACELVLVDVPAA